MQSITVPMKFIYFIRFCTKNKQSKENSRYDTDPLRFQLDDFKDLQHW